MGFSFPWLGIFFWVGLFTWFSIAVWARFLKEKERQLTLRIFAESGKALDAETLEKLFPKQVWPQPPPPWSPAPGSGAKALMIVGIILMSTGVGLAIGAQLVGRLQPEALWGMSTAGAIVGCIGLGLITASVVTRRLAERDKQALLEKADGSR